MTKFFRPLSCTPLGVERHCVIAWKKIWLSFLSFLLYFAGNTPLRDCIKENMTFKFFVPILFSARSKRPLCDCYDFLISYILLHWEIILFLEHQNQDWAPALCRNWSTVVLNSGMLNKTEQSSTLIYQLKSYIYIWYPAYGIYFWQLFESLIWIES